MGEKKKRYNSFQHLESQMLEANPQRQIQQKVVDVHIKPEQKTQIKTVCNKKKKKIIVY